MKTPNTNDLSAVIERIEGFDDTNMLVIYTAGGTQVDIMATDDFKALAAAYQTAIADARREMAQKLLDIGHDHIAISIGDVDCPMCDYIETLGQPEGE
jgi:uncharacterized protein (UPF0212 family)